MNVEIQHPSLRTLVQLKIITVKEYLRHSHGPRRNSGDVVLGTTHLSSTDISDSRHLLLRWSYGSISWIFPMPAVSSLYDVFWKYTAYSATFISSNYKKKTFGRFPVLFLSPTICRFWSLSILVRESCGRAHFIFHLE